MTQYEKYLELALSQANAFQTYWDFYLFVMVGLLGILVTVKVEELSRASIRILIIILFAVFTASNLSGMLHNVDRREALVDIAYVELEKLNSKASGDNIQDIEKGLKSIDYCRVCDSSAVKPIKLDMLCATRPGSRVGLIVFHLFLDVLMILLVWFSTSIRKRL